MQPTIRAAGQAFVVLRLIIVNAGNELNPTSVLTKTVPVDENGMAQAFFSGVPEKTTVCQMKIEGGTLGGKTDFHGASDLKSGSNEVTVTPVGCGDPNDVLAQVVVSVVANPELVKAAPPDLAAKVLAATEFVISGGTSGAEAYQEAFDRTMTTKTFTSFEFTPIAVTFDGGIKQETTNGWTISAAKLWEGIAGAESLRATRVLRQGLSAAKKPMITFSDIAKQRFAIATIDQQSGKITSYVLSDGSSLRNLSAAIIMPEDQSVVFGATANGLPILVHWSATQTSEIGFPPTGNEIKKYFTFPGLASSTSFAQPTVEYLDADAVEKGVINVVVRDHSTLMLKEYRILADGTVVSRQPLPTTVDAPAPIWPLVAMSGSGSVTLNWDKVPNAESYNLYYSFDAEVGSGSKKIENAKNSHTVSGLKNGLTYYFKMTWVIGGQEYGPSRIVAASPKEPAVTAPTGPVVPADIKGVWLFQMTDAQGVAIAGQAPMEIVIRQSASSSVFTMDPEVWVDAGQTWLQTINDGRVTGNKMSWADLRVASGTMGYRTIWSATVNGDSMSGEGSDIMGSSFGGYLTPGDEQGLAANDRWWFTATRKSAAVPEVPAPTVIFYDATLGGAWMVKHNGVGINAFICDGRGTILEHGNALWQAGTYKVNLDGTFALTSGMDNYGAPTTLKNDGKLTNSNTGTIGPEGSPTSYTLERVTSLSAAQGIWAGQLAVSSTVVGNSVPATYSTDVTFVVGPDGRLTSILGSKITGFKGGNFLIGNNGAAHGAFRTGTSFTAAPWAYFSVSGNVTGDEFKGTIEIPIGEGFKAPVVLRRQAPGSRIPTMNELAGTWEAMRSIQSDGRVVEFLPSAGGKRVTYSVAFDGKASLQEYETQQTAAGIQFLDAPVLPLKNAVWVLNGSTIVETHSNNVVCHYQPIMLPDGNLRFVKTYASEQHDDIGVTYIWQRKITNNSLLAGAWLMKPMQDPGLSLGMPYTGVTTLDKYPRTFYMLTDGAGLLTDFGAIANTGGNYQVDANGSWSMTVDPTTDPFVVNGYVNGLSGSWNVAGTSLGGTLERVINPALAQGSWSGSLVIRHNYDGVLATRTVDLSFTVDYNGKVTSLTGTGINGLRGGYMYVGPSGVAKVVLRTSNDRSSPLWEISLEGRLTGDTLYGLAVLDGSDSSNVPVSFGTVSRQTYNAPTFEQLVGTWNIIGGRTSGGVDLTLLPNSEGKFSNFTFAADKTMTGTGYKEESSGNIITNTTEVAWQLNYYWNLNGNMLRFGDQTGAGTHYEIWRAANSPVDPTIMNLECMIDSDDASRTGERMLVRKVNVVTAPVAVTAVTLNKTTASLAIYGKDALVATISPVNATNRRVTWVSSNPAVVTVDGLTGMVTGMSAGTATITATTLDGAKTATCVVTVMAGTINNLSLLSGAWMFTDFENARFYAISNGAGLINDFGAISCTGGTYQVDAEGYLTMTIDPNSDDPMTVKGRVNGNIGTWTIDAEGLGGRMERILDPSLAQGNWVGTATVQYSDYTSGAITNVSNAISFAVDATGRVTSVTGSGISGLRGGWMFITPEGKAKFMVRTTNDRANPWWEFSLEGKIASNTITGRFLVDGASEEGVTPSYTTFIRSAAASSVPLAGLTLPGTMTLAVGSQKTILPSFTPANATNKGVTWSSQNSEVVSVTAAADGSGIVTGLRPGVADIYALSVENGGLRGVCTVTVTDIPGSGIKTASFAQTVSGLNLTNMKIVIRTPNYATYDNHLLVSCLIDGVQTTRGFLKSSALSASQKEAVFVSTETMPYSVLDFSSLTFDSELPAGAVVAVVNLDTQREVATFIVPGTTIGVTGVTLNKTVTSITVGAKETLGAAVAPVDAANKAITWSSSNPAVATVSNTGEVTAIAVGTANITVTTVDGGKTADCAVVVTAASSSTVTGVLLNKNTTSLAVGAKETLVATVAPADAANKSVTWISSNPAVATVSSTGEVTAVAVGTANITVTTNDGSKTAVCAVTVTAAPVPPASGSLALNTTVTGANLAGMQIKVTNVPEDFTTSLTLKNLAGADYLFLTDPVLSSSVSGIVLTYNGLEFSTLADFNALAFTPPIPAGGRVGVANEGTEVAFAVVPGSGTVAVTEVTLNKATTSLLVGAKETLVATVLPADATNKTVVWSTDNASVVTVNSGGEITAVGPGMANVIVTTADGAKIAGCYVVVNDLPVSPNKTVTFTPGVSGSGLTLGNLQVVIRTSNWSTYNNTTFVPVIDASGTIRSQGIAKDPTLSSQQQAVVLTYGAPPEVPDNLLAIKDFSSLDFDYELPVGAVVAIVNGSTQQDVAVYTVTADTVNVTGVTLNKSTTSLTVGAKETLVASVVPANATNKTVSWSSSNASIATVGSTGEITAVAVGNANITATTADGGKTAVCAVTVTAAPPAIAVTGVALNKNTTSLTVGNSEILVATVSPADAANKNVWFSSDNPSVALVASMSGYVSAVAIGTATITVTTVDGGKTANCVVSVTAPSGGAEPAAEDKAAIQGIIDARLNLDIAKYAGAPVNPPEVEAVYATLSPAFLENGMTKTDWHNDILIPASPEDADVVNFVGSGWEYRQVSSDTWLVARLGTINLKDGSSAQMEPLSAFWNYSPDLQTLTAPGLMDPDPQTYSIQLVRKEGGVWMILGDQCKVDWANVLIQFSPDPDYGTKTDLYPFLGELTSFPVASVSVSGSFISGAVSLQKSGSSWSNFSTSVGGIAPNNPGALITMRAAFANGSEQTYVFTQPDFTGMAPLNATVSPDAMIFNWIPLADPSNFRRVEVFYLDADNASVKLTPQFISEDPAVTTKAFLPSDPGFTSGRRVYAHVTIYQKDGMARHYYTFRVLP